MPEMAAAETGRIAAALYRRPNRRVLAAMLDELVDQKGILSEMEVDVAGQQVRRHESFVADHLTFGIQHLVGGLEPAVVAGDPAPVKLVSAVELAAGRKNAVLQRQELSVAEAVDFAVHFDINRNHAHHLVGAVGGAK